MLRTTQVSGAGGANALSIAVIGPDKELRNAIVTAVAGFDVAAPAKEFLSYPAELIEAPQMLAQNYDVVFIDLDSDTEYALDLVESIAADRSATVMVYSARDDRNLVIRCMRAGVREFLNLPLAPGDMAGALARVSVREHLPRHGREKGKRTFVFLGAKGGCGVTTIASNFATSLAQDSGESTLLIDLGLPLGDAAIQLGMICNYSTLNALEEWNRLDGNFLRSLLAEHESGLWVLAGPGDFPRARAPIESIEKLVAVARQSFHYVVVDLGSRMDLKNSSLFEESVCLYLVTQVGISEMRNANRLITQFFTTHSHRLQIVLNRYVSRALGFDDAQVAKALTRQVQWKIPDEDAIGRRALHTMTEFALEESAASKAIRQMARAACGLPALEEKRKAFSLFGHG